MTYSRFGIYAILSATIGLAACQPKPEIAEKTSSSASTPANNTEVTLALLQARAVPVKVRKTEACDQQGCTHYDLQTVQTNLPWIDQYFIERIQKAEPGAFSHAPNEKINLQPEIPQLNQRSIYVRYLGQNQTLASFVLENYSYSAGAAHGLYHQEFVNLDLNKKKRLQLTDILQAGNELKLLDQLYDANTLWLQQHNIERSKLQLSDNFYYGVNGIVFVYPLYALASYEEGMSELTLPYRVAATLIKAEYLPNLPNYPQP